MTPRRARSPAEARNRRAVVDIGSNTVRLVIYGDPPRAPSVLHNEKVTARLGKGVAETGLLSDKATKAALAALARYALLLKLEGVTTVDTVATAAVRDAANGAAFLDAVRGLGLSPRLLSGAEEAAASANGVIGAFPGARGIVADLGGGSLELIEIAAGQCRPGISLPLGTLRLPQLRAADPARFARRIREMVGGSIPVTPGATLYLVGGSFRALAGVAMIAVKSPMSDPHGLMLTRSAAEQLCRTDLRGRLPTEFPGIAASRFASLPDVAQLLAIVLNELAPARLVFSSWGLREGLLHADLPAAVRAQDPLIAGVAAFAASRGVAVADAARVAGWTALAGRASPRAPENLRLAAVMLALASQQLEPNLRATQTMEWALRKRWLDVDGEGRAMLAACALANNGRTSRPDALGRLASPEQLAEAATWGLAIRLCRRLGGISMAALSATTLAIEDSRLVLAIDAACAALVTETAERDLRALAESLALEPQVRIVRGPPG